MTVKLSTLCANYLLGVSTGTHDEKSFRLLFAGGFLDIYSGSRPANADTAESGTILVAIRASAGSSTGGRTGLNWAADAASGVLAKASAQTWNGEAKNSGTATWFRFYTSGYTTGANGICFDGDIATSGADLNMSNTTITDGATTTIDTFTVTLPLS